MMTKKALQNVTYSTIQYFFLFYKHKAILCIYEHVYIIKSVKTCIGMIYRNFKIVIAFGKRGREENREMNGIRVGNRFQLYL